MKLLSINKDKIYKINSDFYQKIENHETNAFLGTMEKNIKIIWIYLRTFLTWLIIIFAFISLILGLFFSFSPSSQLNSTKEDANLVLDIVRGILMALYIFFVPAINWILSLIQNLIVILSLYPLVTDILGIKPQIFIIYTLIILVVLGAFMIIVKMMKIFWSRENSEKEKSSFLINIFQSVALIIFIPIFTVFLNFVAITIIQLIFDASDLKNTDLALIIFNNSFYDGIKDYSSIPLSPTEILPEDLAQFSFFVFMSSTIILLILLWHIIMDLAVRIYEIIVLMFVSPIVISISVNDDNSRFRMWTRITYQKIFSVVLLFGSYTLFLAIIPFISQFSSNALAHYDNLVQQGFVIVMIIAGAFMLESSKTLIAFIFAGNSNAGFATTIQNISSRTNYYKGGIVAGLGYAALPYKFVANKAKIPMSKSVVGNKIVTTSSSISKLGLPGQKKK